MKKYEFTGNTRSYNGVVLHEIRSLVNFGNIKIGDLGGWIESEKNLSQQGESWVYSDAYVFGNARICQNGSVGEFAKVYDNAVVMENAYVAGHTKVYGYAKVYGNSCVKDGVKIYENAKIFGNAEVKGRSVVKGGVEICNDAIIDSFSKIDGFGRIGGDLIIYGSSINLDDYTDYQIYSDNYITRSNYLGGDFILGKTAKIKSYKDIIYLKGGMGLLYEDLIIYKNKKGGISILYGAPWEEFNYFEGSINKFIKYIKETEKGVNIEKIKASLNILKTLMCES